MSNANPSFLGQSGLTGDQKALFLKMFSGETMASFNANTVMDGKTRVRNISSGKSAQFPAIGRVGAEYHTPGAEILGSNVEHGEKVVTIDDLLISHTFISSIDEAFNHYEVRSEYTSQMGAALAQTYDRNLLSMSVKAARDGDTGAVADMGAAVSTNIGATATIQELVDALYTEAAEMDKLHLSSMDRYVVVDPVTYYGLVRNDKLLDQDFGGGNGSYADGNVFKVAGFTIVKSNNLKLDHTAAAETARYPDFNAKYAVDASDTAALVFQTGALATVKLMELATESEYDIRRQGTLAVTKMACGHGVINPQGIRELRYA